MADVLHLRSEGENKAGAYAGHRSKVSSCKQAELSDVGLVGFRPLPAKYKSNKMMFQKCSGTDASVTSAASIFARSLQDTRVSHSAASAAKRVPNVLDKFLNVAEVKPAAASLHEVNNKHTVRKRTDVKYGKKIVLDMPLPRQFDCRPWRCETCKRRGHSMQWAATFADLKQACPNILQTKRQKNARKRYFTRHFLVYAVEVFTESLNLKGLRRALINYYTANSLALAGGAHGLRYMAHTMKRNELKHMLLVALEAYLPTVVKHMSESIHVYSGSAIKHDGNYDIASRVTVLQTVENRRNKRSCHPYSVVHGFLGALICQLICI